MEMSVPVKAGELTLGPVLFNWAPERWRDFYFRIADEAPVDLVYLGEVVCYKRAPLVAPYWTAVVERLATAGKRLVYSSLAEVMAKQERNLVGDVCSAPEMVEANDGAALAALKGRPHHVGPYLNVYNERTLAVLARNGARSVCLPPEMPRNAVEALCAAATEHAVDVEVQVFGRMPLALSARCYHARAHGRTKDTCQFVCENDPDGMTLRTLEGQPFLTVNGIQTMSHAYLNLLPALAELRALGVSRFRLSPQSCDMVEVARVFRAVFEERMEPAAGLVRLNGLQLGAPYCDGFYAGMAGKQASVALLQ
jgi:collagenase-like PrtC family protease